MSTIKHAIQKKDLRFAPDQWRDDAKRMEVEREQADLSQEEFATELYSEYKRPQQTYSNSLHRRTDFGVDVIARAAKKLNVSATWLAWGEGPRLPIRSEDWRIVEILSAVNARKRDLILELATDTPLLPEQHATPPAALPVGPEALREAARCLNELSGMALVNSAEGQLLDRLSMILNPLFANLGQAGSTSKAENPALARGVPARPPALSAKH